MHIQLERFIQTPFFKIWYLSWYNNIRFYGLPSQKQFHTEEEEEEEEEIEHLQYTQKKR